ncbi:hypothetical protein A2U01_0004787, partial [Trifolium medium]|nr:hypothetical protein [Trifolium medium]
MIRTWSIVSQFRFRIWSLQSVCIISQFRFSVGIMNDRWSTGFWFINDGWCVAFRFIRAM